MKSFLRLLLLFLALGTATTTLHAQFAPGRLAAGATVSTTKYFGEFDVFPSFQDGQFWFGADVFLQYNLQGGIINQNTVKHGLSVSLHGGIGQLRYALPVKPVIDPVTDYPGPRKTPSGLFPGRGFGSVNTIDIIPIYGAFHINIFIDSNKKYVPSFFIGAGILRFNPNDDNGNPLPRNAVGTYSTSTWLLPIGVAFEDYINDDLVFNASAKLFLTGTDYLDDMKNFGDGSGTPNDAFFTLGAGLSYYFAGDPDRDGDGLSDSLERKLGTDPNNPDTDGDGLTDAEEYLTYKTNPTISDTDGDGLKDGEEVHQYKTDPINPDTDGDGLSDGQEVLTHKTDPLKPDTDGDGLSDGQEVNTHKTDPLKPDTDGDGLSDGDEVNRTHTNPLNPDTDGDGIPDGKDKCPLVPGVAPDGCPAAVVIPPPAPTPVPVPVPVPQEIKKGTKVDFPGILFIANGDKFDLTQSSTMENLLKIKDLLNQCDEISINIEGHSSSEGNKKRNQQLSEMRAASVKAWLVEQGVAAKKIVKTIGYGSTKPAVTEPKGKKVTPAALEAARKQNRRITVAVVSICK